MDGLPFLPGYRFKDITKQNYHVSRQFRWKNGYALPKNKSIGIGKAPLDVDAFQFNKTSTCGASYDPTMTYGKAKDPPKPLFQPHFVKLDRKCLSFMGYSKQIESKSPIETCRVRRVKITYFLVDDTLSIFEPALENSGYSQGYLLKRCRVPNPHKKNKMWHWSDFNIGKEFSFYGVVYRLCSCDDFTKQFLLSRGQTLGSDESIPYDSYMLIRWQQQQQQLLPKTSGTVDDCQESEAAKLRQFLRYDGQVLRFYSAWYDDTCELPQWKYFVLLYYLANNQVEIQDSKDMNKTECGQNSYTTFLSKTKLPVNWTNLPNFLSNSEARGHEYTKYYEPKDFVIGNTIFVMGRRFFLYDCDLFTRNYFKQKFQIDQPESVQVLDSDKIAPTVYSKLIPPHTGIGDPNDTLQNCLSLMPKPPKTVDFVTYVLNAHKKLRYKLKMIPVYEVDKFRDFIMEFCIGNNQISITEIAGKNSGFIKGRYLASSRIRKPNTNVDDNIFYGTKDFAIGAKLSVRGSVFVIVELDLWTYKYMNCYKYMFTEDAIDGAKSFLESKGLLNPQQIDELHENQKIDKELSKDIISKEIDNVNSCNQ